MRINHNLSAINTHRQLTDNNLYMTKSLERLSSGLRINRSGDDAAGLAISEKMRGQIRGLNQAGRNAQDSISLIQTAEAAMSTTHNILQRMRELAIQSANDTSTDSDRQQLQNELVQLKAEIDRVAYTTEFNTKKLLNGNLTGVKALQGSKLASSQLTAASFVGSVGTAVGGSSITERGSVQTVTGMGYSETGFHELEEFTKVVADVNDRFTFTVNGSGHNSGQIAASAGQGYTRAQFAAAIEQAISNVLVASGVNFEKHQVIVSVSSGNKLQFCTKEASVEATLTIGNPSGSESALAAMGFAGYQNTFEGTADLSVGYTVAAGGTNGEISITLGNTTATVTADSGIYSKDSLITNLQSKLDASFGTGNITIADIDGDGKLEWKSNLKTITFQIASGSTASGLIGLTGLSTGSIASGGIVGSGETVITTGTNTVNGYSDGINIAKGVNDQFSLSLDGRSAVTLTLASRLYATKQDLVNEVNNQIGSDLDLSWKVKAKLTLDNRIEFDSVKLGSSSSVVVMAPPASDQSALGALGFGPTVGSITGTVDISSGVQFSGTTDSYMLHVTLGNKNAMINLLDQANIVLSGGTVSGGETTRDAIVKGLQAELDGAFGGGAINVSTVKTGTVEHLKLTVTTSTSKFVVSSLSGASGANYLFSSAAVIGTGISGMLGSTPTNVQTTGLNQVHKLLATNTFLGDLSDADGINLGISAGNIISFEGTQNGEAFNASMTVRNDSTMGDIMALMRSVDAFQGASLGLDMVRGVIDIAGKAGAVHDLSNLKLSAKRSVTDDTPVGGFNRPLGSFQVIQQAQDESVDRSLTLQVGANQGITDSVDISDMSVSALKLTYIQLGSQIGAQTSISVIDNAMERISNERAKLGAIQNRLENTVYDLSIFSENLTASESRIRDVDMARETMNYSRQAILSQASSAMLAQANHQATNVLFLFR